MMQEFADVDVAEPMLNRISLGKFHLEDFNVVFSRLIFEVVQPLDDERHAVGQHQRGVPGRPVVDEAEPGQPGGLKIPSWGKLAS